MRLAGASTRLTPGTNTMAKKQSDSPETAAAGDAKKPGKAKEAKTRPDAAPAAGTPAGAAGGPAGAPTDGAPAPGGDTAAPSAKKKGRQPGIPPRRGKKL